MSNIKTSVSQLIGHTPLLELCNIEKKDGLSVRLLAKIEGMNPAGSAKDRVGLAMIEDAERRGLLRPAAPSLSRPPEIPASAFAVWLPPGATTASSSCRIP